MLGAQLYGLSTQLEDTATSVKSTRSFTAINLPDLTAQNRDAVGSDLAKIGQLISRTSGKRLVKSELVTREEAYNGE